MQKINLPENMVDSIKKIIEEKRNSDKLTSKFPNKLLREDVLDLLDVYCTVVYYPLPNESNNGFHITGIPDKVGNDHHFVYINTNQTMEKQIFTAAHELGHVWEIDKLVLDDYGEELTDVDNEDIINRFAAELLMPEDEFETVFDNECEKLPITDGKTSLGDFLKIIVAMMNHFFVPQKAIIYRLFELECITTPTLELLLGKSIVPEATISEFILELLRENGHIKFLEPNKKKWIDGLAELLDQAESNNTLSISKIERMRQIFDLPKKQIESNMFENIVDVSSREE